MKILVKGFIYSLVFFLALIVFLPKENLFYYGLQKLKKQNIELNYKKLEDDFDKLSIDKTKVYYQGIEALEVQNIDTKVWFFINNIEFKKVILNDSIKKMVPTIDSFQLLQMQYTLIDPLHIQIKGIFNEGKLKGSFNLIDRVIKIEFYTSKSFKSKYKSLIKLLKYNKEKSTPKGDQYSYEYKL